jgi:hypothetical protein
LKDENAEPAEVDYLKNRMELETLEAVIQDFLSCNPTLSRLGKLKELMGSKALPTSEPTAG